MTVFVSDTSSLLNRPLMLTFATSPYIVTPWLAGPMADSILNGPGFRWGFGIWTMVIPIVVLPLCFLFYFNGRKAVKMGIATPYKVEWSPKAVYQWCVEIDMFGILILVAGMTLFLLPMNIYSRQEDGWRSPMIICMIIFGGLLIIGFVCWELWLATVTFID